jgi:hypothetical protein
MSAEQHYGAHSARVNMWLIVNGASIGITQMGPDFLLVEPAGEHPPGDGMIVLQVDASERRWKVRLPEGVSRASRRVALALNE